MVRLDLQTKPNLVRAQMAVVVACRHPRKSLRQVVPVAEDTRGKAVLPDPRTDVHLARPALLRVVKEFWHRNIKPDVAPDDFEVDANAVRETAFREVFRDGLEVQFLPKLCGQ